MESCQTANSEHVLQEKKLKSQKRISFKQVFNCHRIISVWNDFLHTELSYTTNGSCRETMQTNHYVQTMHVYKDEWVDFSQSNESEHILTDSNGHTQ